MMDEHKDVRRAIRDSRPGYSADSIRSMLRLAADRDATKVDVFQRLYRVRAVRPAADIDDIDDLLVTVGSLANAIGRSDDEREALAVAFDAVELDRDGAWLRLADAWLDVIGAAC